MITPSQLYWLTRLDSIKSYLGGIDMLALLCAVFCTGIIIATTCHITFASNDCLGWYHGKTKEEMEARKKPWEKLRSSSTRILIASISVLSLGSLTNAMLPTTKEMAAIHVVPMIVNSEAAQKLPDVASEFVDLAKDWLKELKPDGKK